MHMHMQMKRTACRDATNMDNTHAHRTCAQNIEAFAVPRPMTTRNEADGTSPTPTRCDRDGWRHPRPVHLGAAFLAASDDACSHSAAQLLLLALKSEGQTPPKLGVGDSEPQTYAIATRTLAAVPPLLRWWMHSDMWQPAAARRLM